MRARATLVFCPPDSAEIYQHATASAAELVASASGEGFLEGAVLRGEGGIARLYGGSQLGEALLVRDKAREGGVHLVDDGVFGFHADVLRQHGDRLVLRYVDRAALGSVFAGNNLEQ